MARPAAFHWPGQRQLTREEFRRLDPWEQAAHLATVSEADREAEGERLLRLEDDGLSPEDLSCGRGYDDGPHSWSSEQGDE
jgi:hypothetical protein